MRTWPETDIQHLLDIAEIALRESISTMKLEATVLRKEKAVGIILLFRVSSLCGNSWKKLCLLYKRPWSSVISAAGFRFARSMVGTTYLLILGIKDLAFCAVRDSLGMLPAIKLCTLAVGTGGGEHLCYT